MTNEELIEKFESENITLASIPKRLLAHLIDELLVTVLFIFIYIDQIPENVNLLQFMEALNGLVGYIVLLKILYQATFVWMYGATLGKIAMKIRVISTEDLEHPTLLFSLIRACVRVVSESVFYLGFLWGALNPKRETWHDQVSNTLVVNVN